MLRDRFTQLARLQRNSEKCALIPKPVNSKKTSSAVFPAFLEMLFSFSTILGSKKDNWAQLRVQFRSHRVRQLRVQSDRRRIPKTAFWMSKIRRIFLLCQLFLITNLRTPPRKLPKMAILEPRLWPTHVKISSNFFF